MVVVCISLMTDDVEHLSHAYCHLYIRFGEISVHVFCSFSNWIFLTVDLESFYIV